MKKLLIILLLLAGLGLACQKEKLSERPERIASNGFQIPNQREQVNPENLNSLLIKDIDGNTYTSVKIGNQTWMAENLKVTRYRDGSPIKYIGNAFVWAGTLQGAYCWYANDERNKAPYGALYNWHAVNSNELAPRGWHIPSMAEWEELISFLNGADMAGGLLKEMGYKHWYYPNTEASDTFGFKALPGGGLAPIAGFDQLYREAIFWTRTLSEVNGRAKYVHMGYNHGMLISSEAHKNYGFSVRCIRDAKP